jgi:FtsH-binding integral membrane protein
MKMRVPTVTDFERRRHPLISRRRFARRMARAMALWLALTVAGLVVGMAGYGTFEGMSLTDSYVNAAMILSGMGPLGELKTTAGKIFAGSYAIFSGLVIVMATGVVLAPIFHRVLHRFHLEMDDKA